MKYFKTKLIAVFVLVGLTFTSCNDWLEMEPISETYGDVFWTSESSVDQTLAGAYSLLRTAMLTGNRFHTWGEINGNYMRTKTLTNQEKFGTTSFPNSSMGEMQWAPFYKVIAQCNLILHEGAKLDDDLFDGGTDGKNKLLGEAYFLRAYTYFYMVKVWGDVPLVLTPTLEVTDAITEDGFIINVGQNPEKEVLEQCIIDLKIAEGYLDYGTLGSSKWAVQGNKGSVQALMAHVYLWLDEPLASEKAADNVITKAGYSLVNYTDSLAVVNMFVGRSTEGIFELNIDYDQSESYTNSGMLHRTVYHPYINNMNEAGSTKHVIKSEVDGLYEETDLRLERFYAYWDTNRPITLKYASVIYEDEARFQTPHGISNIMLIRLSEIVLLRAEALAKLERYGEARILLNTIRERAEATPYVGSDSEMLHEIFLERVRELMGEGHEMFDRIRMDEWEDIGWMTAARKEQRGYYWPVPSTYIIDNPLLRQNPFWATITY
ncbi:RagB/SusD family nutrient uptake outer membrane protein [Cellulophaga sp. F20128]|uniref:RagB/SusD family nutrient uptake outer membrane protein n=1 Tax=Cellulophaga sp. F20128 TaxID=2926413 RepID=UPI001FF699E6|nr:RagB/SusD family nutrient uptake outer membrane protein [Cellulophaga sp. F20128]MCK0158381.1 RagB/SusD family nutrient uptake outer membrane protein [Cellulophaga sp. F20128]